MRANGEGPAEGEGEGERERGRERYSIQSVRLDASCLLGRVVDEVGCFWYAFGADGRRFRVAIVENSSTGRRFIRRTLSSRFIILKRKQDEGPHTYGILYYETTCTQ